MRIVVLGLSITSSWGNGHATTYRGLVRELAGRGHEVIFLERDVPWYAEHRDLPDPPWARTALYRSLEQLEREFGDELREADVVVVGSYVPQGIEVGEYVTRVGRGVKAFYDIDTPVTLANVAAGTCGYLSRKLIPRYDLYLSFTGGPTLRRIEREYGSPRARALYCSVDRRVHYPEPREPRWDLGYLGTYSADRQPSLERLMLGAARRWPRGRMVVAGPQYPALAWPGNLERIEHLAPGDHRAFYNAQRFTLNLTRADMLAAGFSPSVRLFEAAACGVPIISDPWPGLETFFEPGREILISRSAEDTLRHLRELPEQSRIELGARARETVMARHTAAHRARELEQLILEVSRPRRPARRAARPRARTPAVNLDSGADDNP